MDITQPDPATNALTIRSAGASYTANLLVVRDVDGNALLTINNTGVLFALAGIQVVTTGDAEERIRLDQSNGSIYLGDGTHTPDEIFSYDYDSLT